MICFENEGLIDLTFLKLFGASVKEGSNPIGYFGTGLKFAIAVLLRNDCEVVLFRGTEKYEFHKKDCNLRGSDFEVVIMNEDMLGFTTSLGKNWQLWMAYRELYCNMVDEKGVLTKDLSNRSEVGGREGATLIFVKGLDEVVLDHNQYFITGEPNTISAGVEIYNTPSESVFYRGVNVCSPKYTANTYNIENTVELTEDRTLKWNYELSNNIIKAIMQCTDETAIRNALLAEKNKFESELSYSINYCEPSPQFMKVVQELGGKGNKSAFAIWQRTQNIEGEELSEVQKSKLLQSFTVLEGMGIGFDRNKYECLFISGFSDGNTLAEAKDGKIIFSKEAFDSDFTATLLEEYIHLDKGYSDCSRELQTWLFRKCISLTEELIHGRT